jgi:DNA-binding CsgD family transcriptional regulator
MLEGIAPRSDLNGTGRLGPRPGPPAPALIDEVDAINAATGGTSPLYTSMVLAAWRGQVGRMVELVGASVQDAPAEGAGREIGLSEYAMAVLYNGLGCYRAARTAARRVCEHQDLGLFAWGLAELVEASARSGSRDVAAAALRRLEERTPADDTDWALGILARSRALLSDRADADVFYRAALGRLAAGRIALHLARAQLVYGEWLRRERRRVDAREQLRAAYGMFSRVGAEGFAERARRELLATGETVRKRKAETRYELTVREALIARLAGGGQTNLEIGAQLFISPRTVEWHLCKVFIKLGIRSRKELGGALPDTERAAAPA